MWLQRCLNSNKRWYYCHSNTTQGAFKSCAPITKFFIMIGGTTIDNAKDLDIVMLISSNIVQIIQKQQEVYNIIQ